MAKKKTITKHIIVLTAAEAKRILGIEANKHWLKSGALAFLNQPRTLKSGAAIELKDNGRDQSWVITGAAKDGADLQPYLDLLK